MKISMIQPGKFLIEGKTSSVVVGDTLPSVVPTSGRQKIVRLVSTTELPLSHEPKDTPVVYQPGEYEYLGVAVQGIQIQREKDKNSIQLTTAYSFVIDESDVCFLPSTIGPIHEESWDQIREIHVLFVPVDGPEKGVVDGYIKVLEPRILIPYTQGKKHEAIEAFCKGRGINTPEVTSNFEVDASGLQGVEEKIIIVEA